MPCYSEPPPQEDDEDPGRSFGRLIETPSPIKFLSVADVPGYTLIESLNQRFEGHDSPTWIENWSKPGKPGESSNRIRILVYPLKTRSESFETAEEIFRTTRDKNQPRLHGRPNPGSYTGRSIGDFVWAYNTEVVLNRQSWGLLVVQGAYLFRLQANDDSGLRDADVESLALKVAAKLKASKRPGCDDEH